MSAQVPLTRPKLPVGKVLDILRDVSPKTLLSDKVILFAIRGYYNNSMGKPDINDRGDYDDAMFLLGPNFFKSYNANVDPSKAGYRIANLIEGTWRYKPGIHGLSKPASQRYPAFVQADDVKVKRDQIKDLDEGWFGINIHRGGTTSTSSLGCQTIPPSQWNEFYADVMRELQEAKQTSFPYVLVSNDYSKIV